MRLTTGYLPPHPGLAIAYLIAQALLVLTLTMLLSIRLSAVAAGFTVIVFFGVAWISGIAGAIGTALHNEPVHQATLVLSLLVPTDGVWRAAVFALEPAAIAAMSATTAAFNPFVSGSPPAIAYLIWCLAWCACVFSAGLWNFARRDI